MKDEEWREDEIDWDHLPHAPMELFSKWHQQAVETEPWKAGAMMLCTATKEAQPSSRIVLMRGFGERGVRFFTNYNSRKGRELAQNPRAAAVFWWPTQIRQVRLEGEVEKLSRSESEKYFAGRPRGSQLGAWSSQQSQVITDLGDFESRYHKIEKQYENQDVPCPPHWGGYVLRPNRVEFWQGGKSRLHDRVLYSQKEITPESWLIERLSP